MQLFFNISVFFLFCCSFWSERIPPRVPRDLGEAFCQVLLIFSFACIFVCKNLCSLNTQTSASGIFHKASEVRRTALSDGKSCTGYGVSPLPHLPLGIALTGWNVLTLMCLSNEGEIEIKDLGSGGATFLCSSWIWIVPLLWFRYNRNPWRVCACLRLVFFIEERVPCGTIESYTYSQELPYYPISLTMYFSPSSSLL